MNIRELQTWLIDTLWPARCVGCSTIGIDLCGECIRGFKTALYQHSPKSTIDHCVSAFLMEGVAETAIYHLKYRGIRGLAVPLARSAAYALGISSSRPHSFGHNPTFIPVPLHNARLRERGYNQASLIAKEFAAIAAMPFDDTILTRNRRTDSQVTTHSREERIQNMSGAFSVNDASAARGKSFIIIDDVRTTGATLENCASALKESGAHTVSAITIAHG